MSKKQKNRKYKNSAQIRRAERFTTDLGAPLVFCTVEAIALLLFCALLNIFVLNDSNKALITIIEGCMLPFYVFSAGILCLIYKIKSARTKKADFEAKLLETEIYDVFRYVIDLPYAITDQNGKVKIMNGALQDVLGFKSAVSDMDLADFCSVSIKNVIYSAKNRDIYISSDIYDMPPDDARVHGDLITTLADTKRYEISSYLFKIEGESYYFVVFRDVEELLSLQETHYAESPVIAYILIDNLQELTQYVRADYRAASAETENILKDWVAEMNGFIQESTKDKYMVVFSREEFDKQMRSEFDIQKRIRALKIGDNSFPITISMGISAVGESLGQKEAFAAQALSMAIQRGGSQVAVKREDGAGYVFFGGTHKTVENNTTITSRVGGELIESKIAQSSNVIIMGHANPDFDSIGSCVGMARFAMSVIDDKYGDDADKPAVNIVIDKNSESFRVCMSQLEPLEIYDNVFVSREIAKDLVTSETVLIICDVNNPVIYQAPELAKTVNSIALIDHHRLAAALPYVPFLQYVEATKSSASEIVSEILKFSKHADKLHKEEAEVVLSGIMLDTHNFTRNAGAQTFEATRYLYSRGAHTGVVREFFNESLDELLLTGEFESKARIYRDDIAITWMTIDREATPEDRIVASKVADNLLNVKGVKASFALIKINGDVSISGRSKGDINVQLILERLKGGGHFDIAGAQVKNASLTRACEMLKDAIDDYFEYDHHK